MSNNGVMLNAELIRIRGKQVLLETNKHRDASDRL